MEQSPHRARGALVTLVAAACVGLLACSGRHLPITPSHPHMDDGFSGPQAVEREGLDSDPPEALRIHPGDTLDVEVVSTTTQTVPSVLVDATGHIHLPLVHDVDVAGMTLTEAEARIVERWRPLDKLVQINVRMSGFEGQRAVVLGAVGNQGAVKLVPGARVADVLALAGGPRIINEGRLEPADLSGAVLRRGEATLPIDFTEALRGQRRHNVYVHPGDTIYVPPARGQRIVMLGRVGGSTVLGYREGMRLTEALALAGGVAPTGDRYDVRVIRGTLTEPRVYRSNIAALMRGETHDVLMRPGDIIYVSNHWITDVNEVMAIISPLLTTALTVTTASAVVNQNQE